MHFMHIRSLCQFGVIILVPASFEVGSYCSVYEHTSRIKLHSLFPQFRELRYRDIRATTPACLLRILLHTPLHVHAERPNTESRHVGVSFERVKPVGRREWKRSGEMAR